MTPVQRIVFLFVPARVREDADPDEMGDILCDKANAALVWTALVLVLLYAAYRLLSAMA